MPTEFDKLASILNIRRVRTIYVILRKGKHDKSFKVTEQVFEIGLDDFEGLTAHEAAVCKMNYYKKKSGPCELQLRKAMLILE